MIKVTCDKGELEMSINGNCVTLMSELCVIVDSVCESFTEDEEDSESFKNFMMIEVARALMKKVRNSEKSDK